MDLEKNNSDNLLEKMLEKTTKQGECIIWIGQLTERGNPIYYYRSSGEMFFVYPEKLLGELKGIKLPKYRTLKCTNKRCINPEHFIAYRVGSRSQIEIKTAKQLRGWAIKIIELKKKINLLCKEKAISRSAYSALILDIPKQRYFDAEEDTEMKSDIEKLEILLSTEHIDYCHNARRSSDADWVICGQCPIRGTEGCLVSPTIRHAAAQKKLDELRAKEAPRPQTLKDLLAGKTLPVKVSRVEWEKCGGQFIEIVAIRNFIVIGFYHDGMPYSLDINTATTEWLPYTPKPEPIRIECEVEWKKFGDNFFPAATARFVDWQTLLGKKGKLIFIEEA